MSPARLGCYQFFWTSPSSQRERKLLDHTPEQNQVITGFPKRAAGREGSVLLYAESLSEGLQDAITETHLERTGWRRGDGAQMDLGPGDFWWQVEAGPTLAADQRHAGGERGRVRDR